MKDSYATDFKPPRYLVSNERAVKKIAQRYGIPEDEAAKNILPEDDYREWAAKRTRTDEA